LGDISSQNYAFIRDCPLKKEDCGEHLNLAQV
jgi:hypothetical protein